MMISSSASSASREAPVSARWRLDDGHQTIAFASSDGGLPEVIYWGAPLPEFEDLVEAFAATRRDVTSGALDAVSPISLCPEAVGSFPGQPGVVIDERGVPLLPRLRLSHVAQEPGALVFIAVDAAIGLSYTARIATGPAGLLALSATVETNAPVRLHWLSAPVLPGPDLADNIVDVAGRWLSEFQLVQTPWAPGIRMRESRTGRSGHEHFPGAFFPCRGATNTSGEVYAMHYGWSGGHRMVAEELPDGRRQVQFGHAAGSELVPGCHFETATLYATWSGEGMNGAAVRFQRHLRDNLVPWSDRARPRLVHYNCWEAVYMDHDLSTLTAIADRAAAIGAERFVLDDGWFGGEKNGRMDDTSSLGDWKVNRRKWPDGLGPLIGHVRGLGMAFGLWVEPEMVNSNSDLYRAHPDWILGPSDQVLGRGQLCLDMGRPEVRDYLFDAIGALLSQYPIDYMKWDHNRILPMPDAAQTRGTWELIDRLRAAHPDVEFETCASGGGRIDFGILARTHRVWLSDSNDALERLRIQHDAALFLPAAVTGSHVGPRQCHSSGRIFTMAFRAWVAAQRSLGYELDLRELTDEEATTLGAVTRWWKANRDWMMSADILRLEVADPAVTAELQLAANGERFVVFAGQNATSPQILPRPLRLAGLDPMARYRIELVNPDAAPPQSRGTVALKSGKLILTGRRLMSAGISLPIAWPGTMWVLQGGKIADD